MRYKVVFRACEIVEAVNKMPRPFSMDKQQTIILAFQSLLASLKRAAVDYEIHVVEDGISEQLRAILAPEVDVIHATEERGAVHSLAKSFELALSFADEDWVYFCEDDYLHRSECMVYIDELLQHSQVYLGPLDQADLYLHPCDYPDRYRRPDLYTGSAVDRYLIFCSRYCHWREIPSTTYTWLTRAGNIKKDLAVFHENIFHHASYGTGDQYLSETLYKRDDVLCLSPLPGLTAHLHEGVLSPVIDWEAIREQHKPLL